MMIFAPGQQRTNPVQCWENVLLEAFLSHARNLIDFLYSTETPNVDDIIATKIWQVQISDFLDDNRKRINKQLALHTIDEIPKAKKGFETGWMAYELLSAMNNFVAQAPIHLLYQSLLAMFGKEGYPES